MDLFTKNTNQPLADKMRPQSLQDIVGQDHLLGAGKSLAQLLGAKKLPSLILWGPPGCGKTTLARLLAKEVGLAFQAVSAIVGGVSDLRKVFDQAYGNTLLFVDEIHRFNRAQQDVFLSALEEGRIILVGATTENPSFALNAALLSRCQVFVLNRLEDASLNELLVKAEHVMGKPLPLTEEARATLLQMADGDGRSLLNLAETLFLYDKPLSPKELTDVVQRRAPLYDKSKENHYNLISALHKSIRGSDPDAALYWFCRMVDGGEDLRFIARRLVRMASEDIGLADPRALTYAMHAKNAYEFLGSPEGELSLAQVVIYLSVAPKSNAAYMAYKRALQSAKSSGSLSPPAHILNAPTGLMKDLGYGKGYAYDHDTKDGFSGQNYFPDQMKRQSFYEPTERGLESKIGEKLKSLKSIRSSEKI
jgi:putative ATPase